MSVLCVFRSDFLHAQIKSIKLAVFFNLKKSKYTIPQKNFSKPKMFCLQKTYTVNKTDKTCYTLHNNLVYQTALLSFNLFPN